MRSIDPLLEEFVDSLLTTPAIVANDRFDVIASNALARAVSPSLNVGVNLAKATFVNLSAHRTLPQWTEVSVRMVELMKAATHAQPAQAGTDPEASRLATLRAELALHSDEFSRIWSIGALPDSYALEITMDHPDVGRLDITYEVLRLADTRQIVVLGHTMPGSESEQRLFALAAQNDSERTGHE